MGQSHLSASLRVPNASRVDAQCVRCKIYLDGNEPDEVAVGRLCAGCASTHITSLSPRNAAGEHVGPTAPGRYLTVVDDEVIGLEATRGPDGLTWKWDDFDDASDIDNIWTPAWPCVREEDL